jgi:hypothetical protein
LDFTLPHLGHCLAWSTTVAYNLLLLLLNSHCYIKVNDLQQPSSIIEKIVQFQIQVSNPVPMEVGDTLDKTSTRLLDCAIVQSRFTDAVQFWKDKIHCSCHSETLIRAMMYGDRDRVEFRYCRILNSCDKDL